MVEERIQRKLTTILAADVEGYSRLMRVDEEATLKTLGEYREIIDGSITRHDGRVFSTGGDSVLAEFGSAVEAVRCAVEFQEELAARDTEQPDGRRMRFRIGINIGDVMVRDGDLFGDGVNVAARLEGIAEPGGICVSGSTFDQIKHKLSLDFEDMGPQLLKNIAEPVPAFRLVPGPVSVAATETPSATWRLRVPAIASAVAVILVAGGVAWWQPWAPDVDPTPLDKMAFELPDRPSIAVLPFTNMSGDKEQEYFSDGITDDIITDLSKVSSLFVVARNSTFTYKGKSVKVRQIAEDLGVRYMLKGSVRRAGDKVRINAQLIDTSTGGHMWAERYDGSMADVFALQDRVTRKIVSALSLELTAGEEARVARRETASSHAYDVFLEGWGHYLRQRPDDFRNAIASFEKAVALDPAYSRAHAALAATYWQIWKRYWHDRFGFRGPHDPRFKAENILQKAMRDPTPLAYQVSAAMLSQQGRHDEAVAEAERAVALDTNNADSYVALAGAQNLAGRAPEALRQIERAMRLNPFYPPFYLYELGLAQFGTKQMPKAAESLERARALNPDDRWSTRLLLATYGLLGQTEKATGIRTLAVRSWQGLDPLNVRSVTFWYPFKATADAERLAEGLRRAGVPD